MLDALSVLVRFCCPNCGAGMRGSRADGGTVQNCRRCGESIRVPGRQHPYECDLPDPPAVPAQSLARGREGLRLLSLGHTLVVVQGTLIVAAYALWAALEGLPQVTDRDPGPWQNLFLAVWATDLILLAVQSGVKWLGYQKCEAAAFAVESVGWVTLARFAVLLRGLGYLMACAPWLMASTPDATSPLVKAFVQIGHVTWMAGLLGEFGILVVWHRLLTELGDASSAAPVAGFVAWTAGLVLTASACVSLTAMTLIVLLRRVAPAASPPQGVRLNFAAVPPEGWAMVAGLFALLTAFALVVAVKYRAVLKRVERSFDAVPRR